MRLFYHLIEILVLGLILFFMLKFPLFKIPYIQEILTVLIAIVFCFWGVLLYRRTPKNSRKFWIFFLVFSLSFSAQAQYCSWAETYEKQVFTAKKNASVEDNPCTKWGSQWKKARETLNTLKVSPSRFVPSDELTVQQMQNYRSFREDSHWSKWYADKFSGDENLACASQLVSLFSGYEQRHPGTRCRFTSSGSRTVSGSGAKTVIQILNEDSQEYGCWPCRMALIVMSTVQEMSSKLEDSMRQAGKDILVMFMLLWLLYAAFQAVVFPSKGDTFIKDFMTRLLCVLVVATILSSGNALQGLYQNFLTPIVNLGLGLSQEISTATSNSVTNFSDSLRTSFSSDDDYCSASGNGDIFANYWRDSVYDWGGSNETFLSQELQVNLLCMTQKLYRHVSPMTAVGQSLMSFAKANEQKPLGIFSIPNPFSMWLVGFLITVLFNIFSFLVAFKIIDVFLRLGFVLVLMPLFVAAWAFPLTREFTQKGFLFLMSIVSEFLGLVLSIAFITMIFETGIESKKSDLITTINAQYSREYGQNLYNVVISQGGWYFCFMLVAIFFMGTFIISICTSTIHAFFGTKAVGGDITGGVVVSAIKQTASSVWKPASKIAENTKAYKVPDGKSASYLAGRAYGRLKSKQNPLKDLGESNSPAAPKRYFGQKAGNGVNRASQYLAAGVDKVGVGIGQGLSKTGIGAVIGVPLTLGAKTLSTGIRATGAVTSAVIKTTGATVHALKNSQQTMKNIKEGSKNLYNKVMTGPRKIRDAFKQGVDKGKK